VLCASFAKSGVGVSFEEVWMYPKTRFRGTVPSFQRKDSLAFEIHRDENAPNTKGKFWRAPMVWSLLSRDVFVDRVVLVEQPMNRGFDPLDSRCEPTGCRQVRFSTRSMAMSHPVSSAFKQVDQPCIHSVEQEPLVKRCNKGEKNGRDRQPTASILFCPPSPRLS